MAVGINLPRTMPKPPAPPNRSARTIDGVTPIEVTVMGGQGHSMDWRVAEITGIPESQRPGRGHLMIGITLSHYRITEKLGVGGMGEVYRDEDTNPIGRMPSRCCPTFSGATCQEVNPV